MKKARISTDEAREHAKPNGWQIDDLLKALPNNTLKPAWFAAALFHFFGDREQLGAALIDYVRRNTGLPQVKAAVVLLYLGDPSAGETLLSALKASDLSLRDEAIGYLHDIRPSDTKGKLSADVPLTAGEIYKAIAPLLAEPLSAPGKDALAFCLEHGIEAAEPKIKAALEVLTLSETTADGEFVVSLFYKSKELLMPFMRRLLHHPDSQIRAIVAISFLYLRLDDGALDVAAKLLIGSPSSSKREEICGLILTCSKETQSDIARSASDTAQQIIDESLKRDDASAHIKNFIGVWGFYNLLEARLMNDAAGTADWLHSLLEKTALSAEQRVRICTEWMRLSGRVPDNVTNLLLQLPEQQIFDDGLLPKFVKLAGVAALPALLQLIQNYDFAGPTARALGKIRPGKHSADISAALQAASQKESRRSNKQAMAAALAVHAGASDAQLEAMNPWEALPLYWQRDGISLTDTIEMLVKAGASYPPSDEELQKLNIRDGPTFFHALLGVHCIWRSLDDGYREVSHDKLLGDLADLLHPKLAIESLSQTDPVSSDEVLVHFVHHAQAYSFVVNPEDGLTDVTTVVGEFNGFLASIGREERIFQLQLDERIWDGDSAFFFSGKGLPLSKVAAKLHLPLIPHPLHLR